jgi:ubiquinone/menaquinone biosynthesis C-methylase UbiE
MEQPGATEQDARRTQFISLLKAEGRHNVLEIGASKGFNGVQFVRAGIHYTGVDPSEENVHLARARGLDVSVADAWQLPFADGTFSAAWTTTTPQESAATDVDAALRELMRVTAPGAPIAVVLSSGADSRFLLLRTPPPAPGRMS